MSSVLQERSVLMRFSAGMAPQHRKDKKLTGEVKSAHALGSDSGHWVKDLWPATALAKIKTLLNEARAYHDKVTLPFGCRADADGEESATPALAGIGILPAALIAEYGEKMREFKGKLEKLVVVDFLGNPQQWIDWARVQHNGTFDASNYPGCAVDSAGNVSLDEDKFRSVMGRKFYVRTEPLPVPNAEHFTAALTSLLGVDVESVNVRLRDAEVEAKREVVRRLLAPVRAMAEKLAEQPKEGKETPIFRDTLVGNIREICEIAPKLNISGDAEIDALVAEVEGLTRYTPETLRSSASTREEAARAAAATLQRLSGYKL